MADMSIPVATMVGDSMVESLKSQYDDICEKIKTLRDSYMDFCEDETEFNNAMNPIEKDPESYSDGTIKTRPILKKYACALLEKNELEVRMEAAEEALRDINLTPQQVKADMKRYVSICEKKIAKQEEVCKELHKQVEQLTEVVNCVVSHPTFDRTYVNYDLLTHSILRQSPQVIDFMSEQTISKTFKSNVTINGGSTNVSFHSPLHYACIVDDIVSVTMLLKKGENIDLASMTLYSKLFLAYTSYDPKLTLINHRQPNYIYATPLEIASSIGSLELVKFLLLNGANIGVTEYFLVPNGNVGDLVTGCLQTHGSKRVLRF